MSRSGWSMIVSLALLSTVEAQQFSTGGLLDRLHSSGVLIHFVLMEQPSVQQELRATAEQVQAVRALGERQRAQLEGLSQLPQAKAAEKLQQVQTAADAGLQQILSAEQYQRLSQIGLQQGGPLVGLGHPDIAQSLGLTVEQKSELRRLRDELVSQATASAPTGGLRRGGGLQAGIGRIKEAKQQADAQALALLTAEQKTQWQLRQGQPFRGEISFGLGQSAPAARPRLPRR
ncbi:MAG TPA: hypothetical protein VM165_15315 [Planctomycetaceae bacterium]|nr:hypothetical protein [Planctomycetaceae bacterium]